MRIHISPALLPQMWRRQFAGNDLFHSIFAAIRVIISRPMVIKSWGPRKLVLLEVRGRHARKKEAKECGERLGVMAMRQSALAEGGRLRPTLSTESIVELIPYRLLQSHAHSQTLRWPCIWRGADTRRVQSHLFLDPHGLAGQTSGPHN